MSVSRRVLPVLTTSGKCDKASEALHWGQIWKWAGNQLQLGGHERMCLGLGERVVLAPCAEEDEQSQMEPHVSVAASLVNWDAVRTFQQASTESKDAMEPQATVGEQEINDAALRKDKDPSVPEKIVTEWEQPSMRNELCICE